MIFPSMNMQFFLCFLWLTLDSGCGSGWINDSYAKKVICSFPHFKDVNLNHTICYFMLFMQQDFFFENPGSCCSKTENRESFLCTNFMTSIQFLSQELLTINSSQLHILIVIKYIQKNETKMKFMYMVQTLMTTMFILLTATLSTRQNRKATGLEGTILIKNKYMLPKLKFQSLLSNKAILLPSPMVGSVVVKRTCV